MSTPRPDKSLFPKVSNGMKLPNNRTWMPFFIEFIKFAAGFAAVIAVSMFILTFASSGQS